MDPQAHQILLGSNIDRFRKQNSLTIESLAEASNVSIGHMMDVIHARKWVSASLLSRISSALSVSVAALFDDHKGSHASAESIVSQMGKDLSDKIATVVQQTTRDYLKKANH